MMGSLRRRVSQRLIVILMLSIFGVGCQSTQLTPLPAIVPSNSPSSAYATLTPTLRPTPTVPPSATPTSSATRTADPTPTTSPTATLSPTPIGGSGGGLIYQPNDPELILVLQPDASDPSTTIPLLTKAQVEAELDRPVDWLIVESLSPSGKAAILVEYSGEANSDHAIFRGWFYATIDLHTLAPIDPNYALSGPSWNGDGSSLSMLWSPDGSSIVGGCGRSICILSIVNNEVRIQRINSARAIGWSRDSTEVYYDDFSSKLQAYRISDGRKRQIELDLSPQIWYDIYAVGHALADNGTFLLTHEGLFFTLYRLADDFTNPTRVARFSQPCRFFRGIFPSPDGHYILMRSNQCEGRFVLELVIRTSNGVTILKRTSAADPPLGPYTICGWSPDNHLIVVFRNTPGAHISTWDPDDPGQPARWAGTVPQVTSPEVVHDCVSLSQ